ncbi:MAG: hypothetical protein NT150_11555 [Bacteroidetes bacterium]|nr:hypothetical protein [Bacteroidota bacterium]
MKKYFLIVAITILITPFINAQSPCTNYYYNFYPKTVISISNEGSISNIQFTQGNAVIVMDSYGNISSITPTGAGNYSYYDNYDKNTGNQAQLKSFASTVFTYFPLTETNGLAGKIKSIDTLQFNYYTTFDFNAPFGKIKSIGDIKIDYYGTKEITPFDGKIKKIGDYSLTYFTTFDLDAMKGKIKLLEGKMENVLVIPKLY